MVGDRPLFDAWSLDLVTHPALWPPADDTVLSPSEAAQWIWPGVDASAFTTRAVAGEEWASHRPSGQDDKRAVTSWDNDGQETSQW